MPGDFRTTIKGVFSDYKNVFEKLLSFENYIMNDKILDEIKVLLYCETSHFNNWLMFCNKIFPGFRGKLRTPQAEFEKVKMQVVLVWPIEWTEELEEEFLFGERT